MKDVDKIGAKGCSHLSKTHWPNLQKIHLCKKFINIEDNNNIGDKGCSRLSKAHWPNLQVIVLGRAIEINRL